MITDTERLDFLLAYFVIEDVGDESQIFGVSINQVYIEDALSVGAISESDSLRDLIDRAIEREANP